MSWKSALILAIAIAVGGGAGCSKKEEQTSAFVEEWPKHGLTEAQANEVLVTIGDRTITVGEFADRLASQSPYLQARFESPERRREFLENLIRFELLVYEAKRRGYADQPDIQRARRTAMTQQLIKKEVDEQLKLAEITDEEIQEVYDANPHEYDRPAQVRANDILIKGRAEAEKVLAQAQKLDINQFRRLAREKSEDEATKKDGGDLQFFTADAEGHPPKAVRDAAFAVNRVGDVFPEVVKTSEGYHIVMLTGKRAPLKRTYEQAQRAIRHKLAREKKDAAMEALLERLRKDIKVEIDYDALADVKVDIPDLPRGQ
ncbi:MAG: peptidyl-prolyl cis-trans isomerase [Deltaproteobacteria bacterium]|nr:peptidyl-prolyl cis-trans isomerase [Deltaproteobacteria bacterium]